MGSKASRQEEKLTILPTNKCFDDSLEELARLIKERPECADNNEYKLAHGILTLENGELYSHAWLERGNAVIDFGIMSGGEQHGMKVIYKVRKREYYRERKVVEVTRYTPRQAWEWNAVTGHFGPWVPRYRGLTSDGRANA